MGTLKDKPAMAKEVTYKLKADVNNGVLIKLSDFLKLPEVMEAGITMENAKDFICPAPLHLVANANSKSSPVRMVIAPHRQHTITRQSINDSLSAGHHGLPSLQRTILRYRLSTSSYLADLSCYYKRSIIDPLGSLMSAIWLQGEPDSKFPFLDPNSPNQLELWVFRSPNFGYKDASSLEAAGKNKMCRFYQEYFPEGPHKLLPEDLKKVAEILEKAFSDDVLNVIFLPMIEEEDKNPTFPHPDNWNELTLQEKADIMVIVLQIKIICVADFNSHYFKEISSLSKSVEEILNKDTRLDINKPAEKRPDLDKVLEEIKRTRTKNNGHQNNQEDSFQQKTKDDFPLLGLITKRSNGMYSIKGKPNSLRSRAKSAVDITIQNLGEFSNFLDQGHFQRQHISSLLSQCFDPSFTFNAIYHNVARLINRRVLRSTPGIMPMNYRIKKEHYPLLNKLADLFFQVQSLSVPKHLLLPNTSLVNMRNYLLGFSDGSLQFSTACIYLVSCNIVTKEVHTSLITTSSKIAEDTIFAQSQESIPIKEMHGLLLCADSMIKTVEGFQECKIPIDGCLIGVDAVSQIIALRSPPSQFMSRMRKYYANINMHLYKLAELTNQLKENIVFWINQKEAFNPSDLLGKFDIDKDPVSRWIELSKSVLQPPWLMKHPDDYLEKMLTESQEKIRAQTAGGIDKKPINEEELLKHDCVELRRGENVMVNFIDVQDQFKPVRNKPVDFHPLETIVRRNKFKGSNYCLKIMGYVTWIVHNWRDKVYLRKHKACNHSYLCECKKKLLADRKFDRPFTELPIRDPQVINHVIGHNCKNHILVQPSAKDEERLIRVGLLVSTVVSADNTSSPAIPSYMDKYTISEI